MIKIGDDKNTPPHQYLHVQMITRCSHRQNTTLHPNNDIIKIRGTRDTHNITRWYVVVFVITCIVC